LGRKGEQDFSRGRVRGRNDQSVNRHIECRKVLAAGGYAPPSVEEGSGQQKKEMNWIGSHITSREGTETIKISTEYKLP